MLGAEETEVCFELTAECDAGGGGVDGFVVVLQDEDCVLLWGPALRTSG